MPHRTDCHRNIHGRSAAFDALQPHPEDTIITFGDCINRGPDSRGVLNRFLDRGRRYSLVPIPGNQDQRLLEARSGLLSTIWLGMGGLAPI